MKFIKVAALAAIVVSGSAMAGLINQGGWGSWSWRLWWSKFNHEYLPERWR
jgi:ABC-type methionine transport system permease subunit